MKVYRSVEVQLDSSKRAIREQVTSNISSLPENDLIIEVKYTALSYTDALTLTGKCETATYPIVPGIDAAGVVVSSKSPHIRAGDEVIVTGFNLGRTVPGGFGDYISVPAEWALPVPVGLNMKSAVILGTAGVSVAIGISDLINTGIHSGKKIAITGASCDMGAIATALFLKEGYHVTAYIAEAANAKEYVAQLNVQDIKPMSLFVDDKGSDLKDPLYDGAFDTVGGEALSSLLRYMAPNSTTLIGGAYEQAHLNTSLSPFLYRGINLIGINGINCSAKMKTKMWQKLSGDLLTPYIEWLCTEISLEEVETYLPLLLKGHIKGRIIINHNI